ncbi:ABC transporter ATP-binding protein [Kibdelosporangium phytohabitans]|uniref:Iron ABC transporter ATP-binding protein n=1 Tax=Kibdelosporangium phytohabitans TaxID=860235 RepID=A0A0N9HU49_9PSEU|nr:ABC transporter ATP-binding protein [Kibdelosporangium phytohabitans]ALG08513.1 iron ABC transporter ATP-binding protein [Kibdelosporangium phytohabitans]MBE1470418.1 iron complex transport system ATP-binding protein [Kibdelosporangium phytohabitans]
MIDAVGITVRFGANTVLDKVSVAVQQGSWLALVGRNGCGKSTLLRVLAGLHAPAGGTVAIQGKSLTALSRREIARRVAVLSQSMPPVGAMTVRQLVRQGRYAVRGPLGMLADGQDKAEHTALADTAMLDLADAQVDRLSGGERQRARLALALAQDAPVLLLDEPTTYLDVRHQLEVLELVRRLQRERGLTVVTVLHDLSQAARYADRIVALRDGVVHTHGPADEVVDAELLHSVFGVRGRVWRDDLTGKPMCSYDTAAS